MNNHITDGRFANSRRALALQDIRIVSAFVVWAAILGALPILIVRAIA